MTGSFPCRDCGQPIIRAKTNNGRTTLLDEPPSAQGEVAEALVATDRGSIPVAVTLRDKALDQARSAGAELRTVHFFTCPNREEREAA